MFEWIGKMAGFVGSIAASFWTAFTEDTGFFFARAAEAPLANGFEVLVALFLLGVGATLGGGLALAIIGRSTRPFIDWVERFVRFFAYVGAWIILVLIAAMVYEVVSRYFFNSPTSWAFEIAYMLMGTSFMLGIAFCLQMRRHIRVDFIYDHVSVRKRAVIDLVGYAVLMPMLLWLSAGLWDYFHDAYKVGETSGESAWNPIIWPFKYTFVIGFLLTVMQSIVEILKAVMTLAGIEVPEPRPVEEVR